MTKDLSQTLKDAIYLLRDDNLVWSNDFDSIRHAVANLLIEVAEINAPYQSPAAEHLAILLTQDEARISELKIIPWPVKDDSNSVKAYRTL